MNLDTIFNGLEWIPETRLPHHLGINRDELRLLREQKLAENIDFHRGKKRRLEWSRAALQKIAAHLKVLPANTDAVQTPISTTGAPTDAKLKKTPHGGSEVAGDGKKTAPDGDNDPDEPGAVTLLVWRANLPNQRIVEAYQEGTDPRQRQSILRVRVRDASRFSRFDNTGKPMRMLCRHVQADLYEFVGKTPLRRGR